MPASGSAGASSTPGDERSRIARLLGVFADVRPGEAATALLLAFDVFVLLTACYVVKPVREGLILALPHGAEIKSYATGLVALLLVVAVPLYGRISRRFTRSRLVVVITLFFAADLLVFWMLERMPGTHAWLGPVFVLWVGIFNMMVVAQFWAYANDLYVTEQGERLFPLVGIGASVGAVTGSHLTTVLLERIGLSWLMIVAAALLGTSALLVWVIDRREAATMRARPARPPAGRSTSNGLVMVGRHPYLLAMAGFALVFTFVNTNGEYVFGVLVKDAAAQAIALGQITVADTGAYIGRVFGRFHFWVNTLGVVLQAFVVSRLIRSGGLKLALLVVPVIALMSWSAAALLPVLATVWIGKTLENAGDYSINNTARHALWLPLSSELKYNGKQAVDTFFVRLGDVASAGLVFFATIVVPMSLRDLALFNLALAGIWMVLAVRLGRLHRRMARENGASAP